MNPWQHKSPHIDVDSEGSHFRCAPDHPDARMLGLDACLRRAMRELDGESYETRMRSDLRMLALAGFIPERGYKRMSAFKDAVELMAELARNAK